MHIFCTKCGKHIDVSLEELENQSGHLVCPQCLAEIDVDVDIFNGNAPDMSSSDDDITATLEDQEPPKHITPSANPETTSVDDTTQAKHYDNITPAEPSHIDDVIRYCKHCGAFLKEGVNFCPKCGKYVRVTPPPLKPPLTPAQQDAAKLRANTPPVKRIPANKQSTYKPPQEPPYQNIYMGQQRNPLNQVRNSGKYRSAASSKNNGSKPSKFSIHSLEGCLILTLVAVALFFIIYVIIGVTYE